MKLTRTIGTLLLKTTVCDCLIFQQSVPWYLIFATGQIVDAVVMPVAPHAAVIPGKFYHTGQFVSIEDWAYLKIQSWI